MERREIAESIYNNVCARGTKPFFELMEGEFKGMYVILRYLACKEEVSAGDIANKLQVSTARVAVALTNLKHKKYIEKGKSRKDGRKTIVKITTLGREVLEKRQEKVIQKLEEVLSVLSKEEVEQFLNILQKLKGTKGE